MGGFWRSHDYLLYFIQEDLKKGVAKSHGVGVVGLCKVRRSKDFVTHREVEGQNRAIVYKGGSWRDRAYWLSPATRRFLDEGSSRPDLGFRCAMIRVGSPGGF